MAIDFNLQFEIRIDALLLLLSSNGSPRLLLMLISYQAPNVFFIATQFRTSKVAKENKTIYLNLWPFPDKQKNPLAFDRYRIEVI